MLKVWELRVSEAAVGVKLSAVAQMHVMLRRFTHTYTHTHVIKGQRYKSNYQLHRKFNLNDCHRGLFWPITALPLVHTQQPHATLWHPGRRKYSFTNWDKGKREVARTPLRLLSNLFLQHSTVEGNILKAQRKKK